MRRCGLVRGRVSSRFGVGVVGLVVGLVVGVVVVRHGRMCDCDCDCRGRMCVTLAFAIWYSNC